jgi:hypothetical protein
VLQAEAGRGWRRRSEVNIPAMNDVDLLAEIEDILRLIPPKATLRHQTQENFSWLGRAVAAVARWDRVQGTAARAFLSQFHDVMAIQSEKGFLGLMSLLHEARSDLRMRTLGPTNVAIGQGLIFDYFDEVRKLVEPAQNDLLFVDPYLDAEFVSRYLPHVAAGVAIRLLGREKLGTLIPAVKLLAQQSKLSIEVRSAPGFHDRYVIVDKSACFQSGASFKDGGRLAPTTITEITDAFAAVHQTYEDLWKRGKTEFP